MHTRVSALTGPAFLRSVSALCERCAAIGTVLENGLSHNLFFTCPLWELRADPECLFLTAFPSRPGSCELVPQMQLAKCVRVFGASIASGWEFPSLYKLGLQPNGELSVCESVNACCKSLLKLKLVQFIDLAG